MSARRRNGTRVATGVARHAKGTTGQAIGLALCLSALWTLVVGASPARPADPPDAPIVTLVDPALSRPVSGPFRLPLFAPTQLSATATPVAGRTITQVTFEAAVAGSDAWTEVGIALASPFQVAWIPVEGGPYDLRALATDSAGVIGTSQVLVDRIVDLNAPQNAGLLNDPGANLRAAVPLSSQFNSNGLALTDVTYEQHPSAGPRTWTQIGTSIGGPPYRVDFDTATVPDGLYDMRVIAHDEAGNTIYSPTLEQRRVDNTAPSATIVRPPSPLTGRVTLDATADDAGSGVARVRFERAPAGVDTWTLVATDRTAPFSAGVQSTGIPNGVYDFRAVAFDRAGNSGVSASATGIEVRNATIAPTAAPSVQTMAVPVSNPTIIGSIAGSAQNETWAFGFSSAAPAVVGGRALPYTNEGDQLVLIRFREDTGWQIVDVLRESGGTAAFHVPSSAPGQRTIVGRMNPDGDAWLAVSVGSGPTAVRGLFHRPAGGRFALDQTATTAVGDLIGPRMVLRLKQSASGARGVLAGPDQVPTAATAPGPTGTPTPIRAALAFASLENGSWTRTAAPVPVGYSARSGDTLLLTTGDVTTDGAVWGLIGVSEGTSRRPAFLVSRTSAGQWAGTPTTIDAIDLPPDFGATSAKATPVGLVVGPGGPWIDMTANPVGTIQGRIVARFDNAGALAQSWCSPVIESQGCTDVLDGETPATLPAAIFAGPNGPIALAPGVVRFESGLWTRLPAGGLNDGIFTGPDSGWFSAPRAIGRWQTDLAAPSLTTWPQANRNPLLAVAVPPGSPNDLATSGALAVGLDGTALHYDATLGWRNDGLPARAARIQLWGVAFRGPASAMAVGQIGTILRWDGASWSADPQSTTITQNQLNAIAFRADGEGWAVGRFGTILHFDGTTWNIEQPPAEDDGINITSVTVSGDQVFAVIGGNLITRDPDGSWHRAGADVLPDPPPPNGSLRYVSGLRDGGLTVGGVSLVLVRDRASERLRPTDQPLEGIVTALAASRDAAGVLRPFVVVAPPAQDAQGQPLRDVGGLPPGDGELLRQTADGSWVDLSLQQDPGVRPPSEGRIKVDPVLAVAPSADGTRAWAVGGYAGTLTAAGLGTDAVLAARPLGWRTSSIWRYDDGTRNAPVGINNAEVSVPALQGTVSFAFFSGSMCRERCSEVLDAQPDVNLETAATQIAAFARQPGGPVFAIAGGNLRGPQQSETWRLGLGSGEFGRLRTLLKPLGQLPLFAAYGPRDGVPGQDQPSQQWADVFGSAPRPFGAGNAADGIAPVDAGGKIAGVNRYYAFDAIQNGARLRVITLDNSAGSLDDSVPGQTAWLRLQLAEARAQARPIVVVAGQPIRGSRDEGVLVDLFIQSGVSAIFTGNPDQRLNERHLLPEGVAEGVPQVPEYEGAVLGYQETQNNGVAWYMVAVDTTATPPAVRVDAIPVISTLALKPLQGLSVARSQTLQFEAVARRPVATLPTPPTNGFDNYVAIPSPGCGIRPCVPPSYTFTSSDPFIGDFVVPAGAGSRVPQLSSTGRTTSSAASGLFCGFNPGTTLVSVTVGLVSYSAPVTVGGGGFGPPCGTRVQAGRGPIRVVPGAAAPGGLNAPAPAPPPPAPSPQIPAVPLPPPPAPLPLDPGPITGSIAPPVRLPLRTAVATPPPPPPIQPIPPGGATAPSSASAPRREKAKKHATQSAFTIRPDGVDGMAWFFPALAGSSVLALLLVGTAVAGPRRRRQLIPVTATMRSGRR